MLTTYRSWKNGYIVTLSYGDGSWKVALHRRNKMCRFGLGWNLFTKDNEFAIGQNLKFIYVGNSKFQVLLAQ